MFYKLYGFLFIFFIHSSLNAITLSGTVQYERVQSKTIGSSSVLDFSNLKREPAKNILIQAINRDEDIVSSTYSNQNGEYSFNLEANTFIKIRAYAKMLKTDVWDVKVIDNSNGNATYAIEGDLVYTGSYNSKRDLLATASSRNAPPFAILGSIYLAMNKFYTIDKELSLPQLNINWSVNNISTSSYYDGTNNIILQGDQKGDSDEYDSHIIIHEWGHFFENKLSRADNIGGAHGLAEHVDIRVAFGEGFGNALSAIITDNPLYFDTFGNNGWNMNIETSLHETQGWFSEASVQRILYDLYDKHKDKADNLSLGLKPLYQVLIGKQKDTPAFTSLFSFIHALKRENPDKSDKIDAIVSSEGIATIEDDYGTDRISNIEEMALPLYHELEVNSELKKICTSNTYGEYNKLNNHKYLYFTIDENKDYPIVVQQNNGRESNPAFQLFKTSPFEKISTYDNDNSSKEEASITLDSGGYLLDIYDTHFSPQSCFAISIGEESNISTNSQESQSVGLHLPHNKLLLLFLFIIIFLTPLFFIRKELKV